MHAVSQGALGVESRRDDLTVIKMLNRLNHEDTLLRCIAERTFLAKLEGGCSAPIAVTSKITENSILLEGAVFDLEGTTKIQDKFEIHFNTPSITSCPVLTILNENEKQNETDLNSSLKRSFSESEEEECDESESKRLKKEHKNLEEKVEEVKQDLKFYLKHYSFIADLNIEENKMIKAELCGLHLAQKLKEKGADILINEIKAKVLNS